MRTATETVKNREEGMRDSSSLRSAYNNALLGLSKPPAMPVVLTCAWHDADADLLAEALEVKRPPLPDGRATPTRQGQEPEMGCLKEA